MFVFFFDKILVFVYIKGLDSIINLVIKSTCTASFREIRVCLINFDDTFLFLAYINLLAHAALIFNHTVF